MEPPKDEDVLVVACDDGRVGASGLQHRLKRLPTVGVVVILLGCREVGFTVVAPQSIYTVGEADGDETAPRGRHGRDWLPFVLEEIILLTAA